jgi:hypothetical protein
VQQRRGEVGQPGADVALQQRVSHGGRVGLGDKRVVALEVAAHEDPGIGRCPATARQVDPVEQFPESLQLEQLWLRSPIRRGDAEMHLERVVPVRVLVR